MQAQETILAETFPKQEEFLAAVFSGQYNEILYGGAIRGGKTFAGIIALLLLCKKYPGSKWAIVRDSLPTLKRTTIPSFWKVCPKSFVQEYHQGDQRVTMRNGSQILFFPENFVDDKELNRWKGLEVNGFLLEEVNELQKAARDKAIERAGSHVIRGGQTPKPLLLMTCNPANNWVKSEYYDTWKEGTLKPNQLYIPSRIWDNPHIPADYIENLKSLPRYEYEVFVEGKWDIQVRTGGEFYKQFNIDRHVAEVDYRPELPLHISFDFNVRPYMTCTVWQLEGKHTWQIDEICLGSPNNTTEATCIEFLKRYPHPLGLFLYGDPAGKAEDTRTQAGWNDYAIINQKLGHLMPHQRVAPKAPPVAMRGNFINAIFREGYEGISVSIHPKCENTVADYQNLQEAADGGKAKTKTRDPKTGVSYEQYGHTSDANDYFLCEAFKHEFQLFSSGKRFADAPVYIPRTRNAY